MSETRDPRRLQQLADTAYEEICLSGRYSYQRLVEEIDASLRGLGAGERRRRPIVARVAPAVARVEGELTRRGALSARAPEPRFSDGFAPESGAASILPDMCGIAGAINLRGEPVPDLGRRARRDERADRASRARRRRHLGRIERGHVGFAHRRLSIIDLDDRRTSR